MRLVSGHMQLEDWRDGAAIVLLSIALMVVLPVLATVRALWWIWRYFTVTVTR